MKTLQDYEYVIRALVQTPAVKAESISEILASARRDHGPRMSDFIKTREGRTLRVYCERLLVERVDDCDYISDELRMNLASRLYALGFRSNASGWKDLGKECGEIAESMNVNLDMKGKLRRLTCKSGRIGGLGYGVVGTLKRSLGF